MPQRGLQNLARFAVALGLSDVPDAIRHKGKRALVNFFALALAGCRGGLVVAVRRCCRARIY